ncbi:hypothetical protein D623_10018543 [Myotis brandtii]|uniref:Uncharacterized protein n=1 Tax=Myotis brandtii TaxID=109478 RepID=S7N5M4_MYOBR|nr:hypothetical protein D623_10018543 [Myotis brandtii]
MEGNGHLDQNPSQGFTCWFPRGRAQRVLSHSRQTPRHQVEEPGPTGLACVPGDRQTEPRLERLGLSGSVQEEEGLERLGLAGTVQEEEGLERLGLAGTVQEEEGLERLGLAGTVQEE